jgi:hypothetical protein
MKNLLRVLLLGLLVGLPVAAFAGSMMLLGAGGPSGTVVTNYILLVDGTSRLLQTDASSKICKAGGC